MSKKQPKKHRFYLYLVVAVLLVYVGLVIAKSSPTIQPDAYQKTTTLTTSSKSLPWPTTGEAAIGILGHGILETHGKQIPLPTASTAKLITALCILKVKPLKPGQAGPVITLNQNDVNILNKYDSEQGSVLPIVNGEKLTEYQMLEAMMLPSADNIADSLAIWAFGSLPNYDAYAARFVSSLGLNETTIGVDASGYSPTTISSAKDLAQIGEMVETNPILSKIVAMPSASGFPGVGTIKNVDFLLGRNNIVGIKTGNTNQAGGVFVSASKVTVNNQPLTIVTAIDGAPDLYDALIYSQKLVVAVQQDFSVPNQISKYTKDSVVASYSEPWSGKKVNAVLQNSASMSVMNGYSVTAKLQLSAVSKQKLSGDIIGSLTLSNNLQSVKETIPVVLSGNISKPSKIWLFLHPNYVL